MTGGKETAEWAWPFRPTEISNPPLRLRAAEPSELVRDRGEFADPNGDGNLEILRRGKLIDCGDDCLYREGRGLVC